MIFQSLFVQEFLFTSGALEGKGVFMLFEVVEHGLHESLRGVSTSLMRTNKETITVLNIVIVGTLYLDVHVRLRLCLTLNHCIAYSIVVRGG